MRNIARSLSHKPQRLTHMLDQLLSGSLLLDAAVVAQAGILGYIITAVVTAAVLIGCAYVFPGVHIDSFVSALILAVIVGAIVAVAGIVLPTATGLITAIISLVVGAGALMLGDSLMDSVKLDGFIWALAVAAVLAVVNGLLFSTFGTL